MKITLRYLATLTLLLAALATGLAESMPLKPEEKNAIMARVKVMEDAFKNGDADTIIEMTHPVLAKLFGGTEEFQRITRKGVADAKTQIQFDSVEYGEPTALYDAKYDDICFIPRTTLMTYQGVKVKSVGFLVAARRKTGSDWLFVDGSGMRKNPQLLRDLFPGLPEDAPEMPNTIERVKEPGQADAK